MVIFIKNVKIFSQFLVLILFFSNLGINNVFYTNGLQNYESNLKLAAVKAEFEFEHYLVAGSINDDEFVGMKLDQAENLIIYGEIGINTSSDIAFLEHNPSSINLEILLNSTNSTVWGGENNDYVSNLEIDSLGNIYIAGSTSSYGSGGLDLCLIKYSKTLEYQWNKTWGFTSDEVCWDMVIDANDNIFLLGIGSISVERGEIYLVKYDSNGNQIWNKTCSNDLFYLEGSYAGGQWDLLSTDTNNNLYIGYDTFFSDVEYSARLLKYSNSGDLLFNITHTFPEPGMFWEIMIITDETDNVYVLGEQFYTDFTKNSDFSLLKYNNLGILQWNKTWDFVNRNDSPMDIAFDLEGNIYITGISYTSGLSDIALVKYDSNGNLLWEKTSINSDPSIKEEAYGIAFDSKNNVYLAGVSDDTELGDDDMLLVIYSAQGELLGSYTWGLNNTERAYEIKINSNDEIFVAGTTNSFTHGKDWYLAKVKVEFKTIENGGFDFILLIVGISIAAAVIIGVSIVVKIMLKKRKS
ncbi:MAG: SBBP repeat-containing protein [Promethearchaeota archaeon]